MEAEAKFTYVGAAVLALIAALVFSVIWLKRTGAERDYSRYTIYFEQQALDGLAVGSEVNMRGIAIGRVLDYKLSPEHLNRARVDIRVDRQAPVRENTVAVITRNFVTGIAQIRLVTAEPAGPPLEKVAEGQRYPVIAEGRSDLAEITGRVTELGEMAGDVLNNVNQLFTPDNRQAFAEALASLRDLSKDLNRQLGGVDRALADIAGAAREFRRTSAAIGAATGRVSDSATAVAGDMRVLIEDVRGVAAQTDRSLRQVADSVARLESKAAAAIDRIDASASAADDQLRLAVGELRSSLEAVHRSLDRLSDPRAALLGPEGSRLGPGEKLQ